MRHKLTFVIVALLAAVVGCPDSTEEPNQAPELGPMTAQHTLRAHEIVRHEIGATDPEGDAMYFRITNNPGFVSIENFSQQNGTATATVVIAPTTGHMGTHQFQVRVEDTHGEADSETCTVNVMEPAVDSVAVSPSSVTVTVGETAQLSATPLDVQGNVLSGRTVTWSSSDVGVATVDADGLVTAVAEGSATITATSGGVSGTATIVVSAPSETAVYLRTDPDRFLATDPQPSLYVRHFYTGSLDWVALLGNDLVEGSYELSLWLGIAGEASSKTFEVSLIARQAEGELELGKGTVATYAGQDCERATGNMDVQAGAVAGDKIILRVKELGDETGVVCISSTKDSHVVVPEHVSVTRVPIDTVIVRPDSTILDVDETMSLTTTVIDVFGDTVTDRAITWETSDASVATVDSDGVVTGVGAGQATISATSNGTSGTAKVSVFDQLKWKYSINGGSILTCPAVDSDGTIYVGLGTVYAINPDGTLKWESTAGSSIYYSSPAIGPDGTIYAADHMYPDAKLYALNPDGTLKWEYALSQMYVPSSPAVGSDGTIYILTSSYLYAIDSEGAFKWKYSVGGGLGPSSTPAIAADGTVYIGSTDDYLYAINPDGTLKWRFATNSDVISTPAIGPDGTVYVGSEDTYAINPDGTLRWRFDSGRAESSPAIGPDGTVYVGSFDNHLYAINSDGTIRWGFKTGGDVVSSPAVGSDGMVYVGSKDYRLYAIDPNGREKWHVFTGNPVESSPTIAPDGTVYVGGLRGDLFAISTDSDGLADTSWPKFRHDLSNTGNISGH